MKKTTCGLTYAHERHVYETEVYTIDICSGEIIGD